MLVAAVAAGAAALIIFGGPKLAGTLPPHFSDAVVLADWQVEFAAAQGAPTGSRVARYTLHVRNDGPYRLEDVMLRLVPTDDMSLVGFVGTDPDAPDIESGETVEFIRWVEEDALGARATELAERSASDRATEASAAPGATQSLSAWLLDDMSRPPDETVRISSVQFDDLFRDPAAAVAAELQYSVGPPEPHGGGAVLHLTDNRVGVVR